jgi:hypothetical protein
MDWQTKNDKNMMIQMLKKDKKECEDKLKAINAKLQKYRWEIWWKDKQTERI